MPPKNETGDTDPGKSLRYYLARIENDVAKVAAIRAAQIPATDQATRVAARTEQAPEEDSRTRRTYDVGDRRVVIKFYYDRPSPFMNHLS